MYKYFSTTDYLSEDDSQPVTNKYPVKQESKQILMIYLCYLLKLTEASIKEHVLEFSANLKCRFSEIPGKKPLLRI